ncbi:MAG: prolyl oligopeptidase family serine peptidase [Myxococcota bacterium]|nr:prolyl oligopeptidase family serine peptidase [Myxococcota bacterium]
MIRLTLGPATLALALTALLAAPSWGAGKLIPAHEMYAAPALQLVEMNPSGSHIAAHALHSGTHGVLIQEVATGEVEPVFRAKQPIAFGWVDDDTLVVAVHGRNVIDSYLIELDQQEWQLGFQKHRVKAAGWPVFKGMLAATEDELLWATWDEERSRVYRAPTSELLDPQGRGSQPHKRHLVGATSGWAQGWVVDRRGVVRAVLAVQNPKDPEWVLRYRAGPGEKWVELDRWEDEDDAARPVGLASNDRDLLVLSREERDTRALVEYLVSERKLGEVVFANPGIDVVDVLYDYHGAEVQAAIYESGGLRQYHHLREFDAGQQQWLEERFPGQSVALTSLTLDRHLMSVLVSGPRNPGDFYVVDTKNERVLDVGKVMPHLSPEDLVDVQALEVESADGTRVEAFLALPRAFGGRRPPLVVMPHGGPLGVRDDRHFNPDVQYLAVAGFAVLTVNYRGSEGYGRAFLDAGRREWSEGIEDDIEAAVDIVVAQDAVDPERMCIYGASYGGYSALISATRRPQRYVCAASLNGPSDLLLVFQSSDFAATEEGRRVFAGIVGDPKTERERLVRISPAYRAAEIDIPVLLAHGTEDRRVDVEHAYRMKAMLEAHGKRVEWVLLEGAPHSPSPQQYVDFVTKLHRFLYRHLYR